MQNKRTMLIMGILVLVVGAAAFIGGRMLNNNVNPFGLFGLGGDGKMMAVTINMVPAEELPKTQPEIVGQFVERKDNTIVAASLPLKAGGGGEAVAGVRVDAEDGPKVEIIITKETIIYCDTTERDKPKPGETKTIQQTVGEGTLDDINTDSIITVWGRKSGDRIIADVLFYTTPVFFKGRGP